MIHQCKFCRLRKVNFLQRFLKINSLSFFWINIVQHRLKSIPFKYLYVLLSQMCDLVITACNLLVVIIDSWLRFIPHVRWPNIIQHCKSWNASCSLQLFWLTDQSKRSIVLCLRKNGPMTDEKYSEYYSNIFVISILRSSEIMVTLISLGKFSHFKIVNLKF